MSRINHTSSIPKYQQIVEGVLRSLETGELKLEDKLPSVNQWLIEEDVSRDTVVKAYDILKERGIITSIPGKGYYIQTVNIEQEARIFLLFNKLSAHKKIIYDAFTTALGDQAKIDFFVYHNELRIFEELIHTHLHRGYSHFVIVPHFFSGELKAPDILRKIPRRKLILLDKHLPELGPHCASVYQDFAYDISQALIEALPLLRKYQRLKLIFPKGSYYAIEILDGFEDFGEAHQLPTEILPEVSEEAIQEGDVFITLRDDDLVSLIKLLKEQGRQVGSEIGLISYNESPLKEILLDGITVMSTDFANLGQQAAQLILDKEVRQVANPFRLIVRRSL